MISSGFFTAEAVEFSVPLDSDRLSSDFFGGLELLPSELASTSFFSAGFSIFDFALFCGSPALTSCCFLPSSFSFTGFGGLSCEPLDVSPPLGSCSLPPFLSENSHLLCHAPCRTILSHPVPAICSRSPGHSAVECQALCRSWPRLV